MNKPFPLYRACQPWGNRISSVVILARHCEPPQVAQQSPYWQRDGSTAPHVLLRRFAPRNDDSGYSYPNAIARHGKIFVRLDAELFQTCLSDAITLLSSPARP
jgi:hypothetical protein